MQFMYYYLILKTQDPKYVYARYCAVIYNGATNHVHHTNTVNKGVTFCGYSWEVA